MIVRLRHAGNSRASTLVTRWRRAMLTVAGAAGLLLVATATAQQTKDGDDAPGQKFKDWTLRCEDFKRSDGEAFKQCHIFQDWKHKDKKLRILHVAVAYPPNSPERAVAVLTMPLGIFLPAGVKIKVDEGELRSLVVERCEPVGCKAGFPVTPDQLLEFKKGLKAFVTFHDMRRKPVTVPVSLRGFTKALAALK
ncbi:MAG: invasion associated locus B family protein [Pseudomonadota bacterium]